MNLTLMQFVALAQCSTLTAGVWVEPMNSAMAAWGIDTPHRVAGFFAQITHECGHFGRLEENLNYSAQRLMAVWPSRFPTLERAKRYAYRPEALANEVYANRMGNGPFESGDGWRFRGRCPIMATGRSMYLEVGLYLGIDLLEEPDALLVPGHGADASACTWAHKGCNELMDRATFEAITKAKDGDFFEQVTKRINGGLIGHEDGNDTGLDDRVELYVHNCQVLGI